MAWINVNDELPEHEQIVLVKIGKDIGVAEYDKDFGFRADSSAYLIYCHDDSGLEVNLDGIVTYWMKRPE